MTDALLKNVGANDRLSEEELDFRYNWNLHKERYEQKRGEFVEMRDKVDLARIKVKTLADSLTQEEASRREIDDLKS